MNGIRHVWDETWLVHKFLPEIMGVLGKKRHVWQFPLKMLHLGNPPNRETQIPRYLVVQFKLRSWFNLNLYREVEFLDLEDFGGVAFWVESVIREVSFTNSYQKSWVVLEKKDTRMRRVSSTNSFQNSWVVLEKKIISGMGWLRFVGSLKLYVSFLQEPYKREYILQW